MATERGLVCDSCQEQVGIHDCGLCDSPIRDDDFIYCRSHSQTDSEHFHQLCADNSQREV